jgi:hypothetical protein
MVIFEIIPEQLARFHPNRTNFSFDNLAFHLNSLFFFRVEARKQGRKKEKAPSICFCSRGSRGSRGSWLNCLYSAGQV